MAKRLTVESWEVADLFSFLARSQRFRGGTALVKCLIYKENAFRKTKDHEDDKCFICTNIAWQTCPWSTSRGSMPYDFCREPTRTPTLVAVLGRSPPKRSIKWSKWKSPRTTDQDMDLSYLVIGSEWDHLRCSIGHRILAFLYRDSKPKLKGRTRVIAQTIPSTSPFSVRGMKANTFWIDIKDIWFSSRLQPLFNATSGIFWLLLLWSMNFSLVILYTGLYTLASTEMRLPSRMSQDVAMPSLRKL